MRTGGIDLLKGVLAYIISLPGGPTARTRDRARGPFARTARAARRSR